MAAYKGIDVSGLDEFIADLTDAGATIGRRALPVVKKGADNIMRDARRNISGLPHAPEYPFSITYDTELTPLGVVAEIGPDKDLDGKQGALGNILEYGTSEQGPQPHLAPALDREIPIIEKYLADVLAGRL